MIKYIIMDVDGTLTDGKIYMGSEGEAMKAFSSKDGYVINYILKPLGIVPIILTARTSLIVQHRCNELGITEIYQGKLDKFNALKEIVGEKNFENCAYFGDDILDLNCMDPIRRAGGIVGCPADAVNKIKAKADYICMTKAGEGALREFVEWLTGERTSKKIIQSRVDEALKYLRDLKITKADIGKHIVDQNFFFIVQEYVTKLESEFKLESHREYIDIQLIVNGCEAMDLSDISRLNILEEYSAVNDVLLWEAPERMMRVTLKKGDYIILYPENAHRGAVRLGKEEKVLKIIGKIRLV